MYIGRVDTTRAYPSVAMVDHRHQAITMDIAVHVAGGDMQGGGGGGGAPAGVDRGKKPLRHILLALSLGRIYRH